jgi:hypothetical protein
MRMYQHLAIMRTDIRTVAGAEALTDADYAVFQNKSTEFSDQARRLLAGRGPTATLGEHGVPLVFIFHLTRDETPDGGDAQ